MPVVNDHIYIHSDVLICHRAKGHQTVINSGEWLGVYLATYYHATCVRKPIRIRILIGN